MDGSGVGVGGEAEGEEEAWGEGRKEEGMGGRGGSSGKSSGGMFLAHAVE